MIEGEYDENIQFLYNGQYGVVTDGNGLYYMRARYYNVDIKRFINQDVRAGTLERISSLNRYSYVEGNPVNYLDPFGLDRWIYDEAHKVVSYINYIFSIVVTALTALGAFLITFCFEIGVYISEMMAVGIDKESFDRFAQATIENFGMLLLGLVEGLSLGVKIFHAIASIIKAAIDVDKTYYPKDYY